MAPCGICAGRPPVTLEARAQPGPGSGVTEDRAPRNRLETNLFPGALGTTRAKVRSPAPEVDHTVNPPMARSPEVKAA